MTIPVIKYDPGTLAEGYDTYSPVFLKRMFNGKKVSHILPYDAPQNSEEDAEKFLENRKGISISGVQEKLSLMLDNNQLRLTNEGEQGTYILKPIPRDLKRVGQVPANEHLTMQLASQVYGIRTAECGVIFFKDGSPAYITKRFDVKDDGSKWAKEDFATLAGKTKDKDGTNFKYEYSYEEIGIFIQKFVPAWRIEIERYFSIVLFNYLFSNGDAHLKNFALLETQSGDYLLSPAYDLINSRIHIDDTDFALKLFADNFESDTFRKFHRRSSVDFIELGKRIGIEETRLLRIMEPFLQRQLFTEELISRSFLDEKTKRGYLLLYETKRNALNEK